MKRKYLHVEILDGTLHIYSDDRRWRGDKLTTLEELDYECAVGEVDENICITIPVNYDSRFDKTGAKLRTTGLR